VQLANKVVNSQGSTVILKPKSHGTVRVEIESMLVGKGKVDGSGVGVDVVSCTN
ncbi:hypothetical protein L195_g060698, partial [Trifolium pratense]